MKIIRMQAILLVLFLAVALPVYGTQQAVEEPLVHEIELPKEKGEQDTQNNTGEMVSKDVPVDEDTYVEQPPLPNHTPRLSDGLVGRGQVEDVEKYWAQYGYPEGVSFACEAGGEVLDDGTLIAWWEIGVVGGDEGVKQAVLDLISTDARVTFTDANYSYAQRKVIFDEISAAENPDILQVILGRNTEAVIVGVAENKVEQYKADLQQQYGTLVTVIAQNDIAEDLALDKGVLPEIGLEPMNPVLQAQTGLVRLKNAGMWLLIGIGALGGGVFVWRGRAVQTTAGTVVSTTKHMSKKALVQAIKNDTAVPKDTALQEIWSKIKK